MMNKKWLNSFTSAIFLTLVSLFIYSQDFMLFALFEFKSFDLKIRMRGERYITDQVVIVAIDEKSLQKEGRWPWPRERMKLLIQRLSDAGVGIAGIDIIFPEPEKNISPDRLKYFINGKDFSSYDEKGLDLLIEGMNTGDKELAQTIENTERTVLSYFVYASPEQTSASFEKLQETHLKLLDFSQFSIVQRFHAPEDKLPIRQIYSVGMSLPGLMDAANSAGFVSFVPEIDGVVRRVPIMMQYEDYLFPSLALQLVHEATSLALAVDLYPFGVDKLMLGDNVIPVSEIGDFLVNYYGPAYSFTYYSATDVLSGKVGANELANKIILVGGTAAGTHDLHNSPYGPIYPGVEVHANVIENILQGDFLIRPEWIKALDLLIIIFSGLLVGLISYFFSAYAAVTLLFFGVIGYLFADFYLFHQKGIWLHTFYPIFTQIFVYSGTTLYKYGVEERQKKFIKGAFSKYIAPEFVEKLVESPELLKPGGSEIEMTIFFSDLIGFTSISEKMNPTELAKFINEYFTEMTAIVLDQGGTVIQYAGDAMMVGFGAPKALSDHAERAVISGWNMQKRLVELNKQWSARGLAEMGCRIGINTGKMVFGNLGSQQVYYYAAMGDNVNLAARLETANKQYGTKIMISEATYEYLQPNRYRTRILDIITVKGKTKPVKVYEVYGTLSDDLPPEDIYYYQTYHEAFENYLNREFSLAAEKFDVAKTLRPKDPATKGMIARIQTLNIQTLPEEWDGSIALTSK